MFPARLLIGSDGCDRWSTQTIWDDVLRHIRIVVSSHQILLDAFAHGFVQLDSLALLVFDEAHHCVGKHAANKIMQKFYHPSKSCGVTGLPSVIGLTASPIFGGRQSSELWCV